MQDITIHSNTLPETFEHAIVLAKANEARRLVFLFEKHAPRKMHLSVTLAGKKSSVEILWAYKGSGDMQTDIALDIVHKAEGTASNVNFKGALADSSRVTFHGTVRIEKSAKYADAKLGAKALLLSEQARAFIKPDLEILQNEVKASHGSSIGRVSAKDLFYLRSRGLSEKEAKKICVAGFFQDMSNVLALTP
ncbi:hypothetical protein A3C91_02740 [Candidatus Azambacteria bacterium RIFCSPHIGHO2_02_FULL_52_12]|uniref:SUF system FeS cluster assembly SufBD core domain-containing protein n=1 Tax=Candidatus Azambacteria bacterium RIFCSPLOWO2_01_FULL_46_25 TaxID=1797298 RepID=A0A1F5BTG2_9BACT|nr:MAG: hypothetical protein A3C91_02740 [Candidatus Azambacteria bacterium RIFCSPHIGHO2_02_FULL_52_12]OGD33906.1 MAG: hypothetical protein A2988_00225 [Candidatus Azambacteria bacterium RIFCSPLOWO2_01_FULL_46_25]OGD37149.1 MAG: hypothetical protein A2850_04225 [Candidatus Azambacteria bacterium RIFCSPHIGHO2_01_FULL_51_74]